MGFTYRDPDRSTDPRRAVPGARSIVVAARSYLADEEPPRPPGVQARVARYAWVDHYAPLRAGLRAMARRLRAAGERAVAYADDNAIVDREVAYRAGLGWFGKNANLLVPGAGSWFVLGCVVTTASLPVATGVVADGCGTCPRCLDACPTGAIVAPGVDRRQSLPRLGAATPGCHPGRAPAGGRRPPVRLRRLPRGVPADRPPRPAPPPTAAARTPRRGSTCSTCSPPTTRRCSSATGGGTSPGRDPRWLRRNALVILGNTRRPGRPRVAPTLARYAAGDDDVLAEHARWASGAARRRAVAARAGGGRAP